MSFAYAWPPSVEAGGTLRVHMSSTAARLSLNVRPIAGDGWATTLTTCGEHAPPGPCDRPWDWPAVEFAVPGDARSGVYLISAFDGAEPSLRRPSVDERSRRALFTVRQVTRRARIAYVLPLFTYHAYGVATHDPFTPAASGEGLYTGARAVTLARPGGGTGARLWDEGNIDVYDRTSPRQTFAHWDEPALRWLRSNGHDVDILTDWELHVHRPPLNGYALLLFFGHHEYWTREMRQAVERFRDDGGNIAFFCGNTCWFRIRYDDVTRAMTRAGRWEDEPEDGLTGLSYAFGGGKWIGERPPSGYAVRMPQHWLFAGCGLSAGEEFGADGRVVGYECDGLADDPDARGVAPDRAVLAEGSIAHWRVSDGSGERSPAARTTILAYRRGGTVLNTGTADWARLLGADATITRITHNAVHRLAASEQAERRRT